MNDVTIIAEAGVNHNGNIKNAFKLIDIAKKAGANYIKFQIFKPNLVASKVANLAKYQKKNQKNSKKQIEMIRKLELSQDEFIKVFNYANKKKINFLCTPFDLDSYEFLKLSLRQKVFKISSGDITNFPLIAKIGQDKNKIIISTGMSNLKDIETSLKFYLFSYINKKIPKNFKSVNKLNIFDYKNLIKNKISILHCNTSYPTPLSDANLNAIDYLKSKFPFARIGFSDHTTSILTPLLALSKGSQIIEKHFTFNKNSIGPDHAASLNPSELKKMILLIKKYENCFGVKGKFVTKSEYENFKIARRSIYSKKKISKGEFFNINNIAMKRPFNEKSKPQKYFDIVGTKAKRNYSEDELIVT